MKERKKEKERKRKKERRKIDLKKKSCPVWMLGFFCLFVFSFEETDFILRIFTLKNSKSGTFLEHTDLYLKGTIDKDSPEIIRTSRKIQLLLLKPTKITPGHMVYPT